MARGTQDAQLDPQVQKAGPLGFSAWVEVNLSALEHNLQLAKGRSPTPILPILKGDAYGHGAPVIAAFLKSKGCSALGVSTVEEALDILEWTNAQIVLLTPPLPEQLPAVVERGMIPTITSPEVVPQLNRLAKLRKRVLTVQIKVDTGFGRLGVAPQDFAGLADLIRNASHLHLGGVFTHFAAAACDRKFTQQQLEQFLALRSQFQASFGSGDVIWHAANSAAYLTMPASHLDLVRLGNVLYGQTSLRRPRFWDLQGTWQFKARIIHTRWLPPGHSVGYSRAYHTSRATRLGVIPVGYAQGLELEPQGSPWRQIKRAAARTLFPKHPVSQGQEPIPIMGRISMGLSCLDLTASDLEAGDVVTVHMRRVAAGRQIPRLYFLQGKLKCIFWNHQVLNPQGRKINLRGLF
ncbi:alanine racemase [Candidatus Darwinibacter acetoxidans]